MPAASAVPVEERLFSLVLALLATESGLTKAEVLSTVQGYRQRYDRAGDNASLERQFERDKDDIRELGVPLETVESPGDPGNNQTLRYRIAKGAYELPPDLTFTAEELTLLSLAGAVWREGSLSSESRRAVLKLRSLGVDAGGPMLGYAPRVRSRDDAFPALRDALDRAVVVTFDYLKPGDPEVRRRRVAPLALVQHRGRWHLFAVDRTAERERTFLLSRIVGPVRLTAEHADAAADGDAARALADLDALWDRNVATVDVVPETDAAVRLATRDGARVDGGRIAVHYTDENLLADELAAFGDEVLVLDPPTLVDAVRRRLALVVRDHRSDQGASA